MDYKVKEREVKVGEGQVVIMCHYIKKKNYVNMKLVKS